MAGAGFRSYAAIIHAVTKPTGDVRASTVPLLKLLVRAVLVVTASTQPVFILGAAFFQIGPEFGIGPIGLGSLTASFFLTASVASVPVGRWVQRVGWQRAMRLNMAASSVVMLTMAGLARGFWSMAFGLVVAAAIYAIANPAANLALSQHVDPAHRATIFGAKHAGIPASALLAGLAVPLVVINVGWRWAVVAAALLAVGVGFSIPRGEVLATIGESHELEDRSGESPLSVRWLVGLATGSALATWAAIGLGTYLVSAAIDVGFTEAAAGWLQFTGAAVSIGARIMVGVLTDKFRWDGFAGIVVLAAVGAIVFLILPFVSSVWFVVATLVAYATGWGWPGLMTFTVVDSNRGSVAASSGITQAGVFIGAGAGPLVLGYAIERGSYSMAWFTVAIALALASLIIATIRHRRSRVQLAV